jgi:hypothetical protein
VFRLKRLLLSLYPDPAGKLATTPASRSMTRAEGIYDLERETFALLGARVPSEPPLDLLTSALVPTCWIAFWVRLLVANGRDDAALGYIGGHLNLEFVFFVAAAQLLPALLLSLPPAALRLAWLAAAWRARTGRTRSTWLLGDEVRVSWHPTPVHLRSPLLIGWPALMYLSFMCRFFLWWPADPVTWAVILVTWLALLRLWWSTARDLRGLGRKYGLDRLHRRNPLWRLPAGAQVLVLASLCLLPSPVMLFFAARQVREAQLAVGIGTPIARSVAWLGFILPVLPVQCALLQRQLNRIWLAEATHTAPPHE